MFGKRKIEELTEEVERLRNLNESLLKRNEKLISLMEFIQDEEHMAEVEIYNMDNKPVYKFKTCLINIKKEGIIVRLSDTTFADLNLSYNCSYDVKVKLYTERRNYPILNTDLVICLDDESLDISNWDVSKVTSMDDMFRNYTSLTTREIEKSRVGMLIDIEDLI